jgi:hypothetical protein
LVGDEDYFENNGEEGADVAVVMDAVDTPWWWMMMKMWF